MMDTATLRRLLAIGALIVALVGFAAGAHMYLVIAIILLAVAALI